MRRGIAIALIIGTAAIGACGDDDAAEPDTTVVATTAATEPDMTTPTDLGTEIGDVYLSAYDEAVDLLADRPDPAAAGSSLAALKESKIEQLVALGHQREALDPADRVAVDANISNALSRLPSETFEAYQEALEHYGSDTEVAQLLRDINIIGQYANFDLLREQAPDEADRLGVG